MEKLNKKGFFQTAEWIVATLIIIGILIVFSIFTSLMIYYKSVTVSLVPTTDFKEAESIDIASEKSFENFVKVNVVLDNKQTKIYQIISSASGSDSGIKVEEFKKKALELLKFLIKAPYSTGWIKIYPANEDASDVTKSFGIYDVIQGSCNPINSNSYTLYFNDNKIVLCLR